MTKVGTLIRFNKNETDKKKNTHCNDFQAVFLLKHKAILCRFFYVCCIVGHHNYILGPPLNSERELVRKAAKVPRMTQKRPGSAARARIVVVI